MERYCVGTPQSLIAFLAQSMPEAKKSTLKKRIQAGGVRVNAEAVTRATWPLRAGDVVEMGSKAATSTPGRTAIPVIFSDDALFVVDKPAGLLSVPGGGESEKTAHARALDVVRQTKSGKQAGLEVVHRLDRETSGVLAFARTKEDARAVMSGWKRATKEYFAVVDGSMPASAGTIDAPLWEHPKSLRVHVGAKEGAVDAVTHYVVEREAFGRSLLRVTLETGRKHQIRAHLFSLGCPIVGDDRYGEKFRGGLMLHAHSLTLEHPRTLTSTTFVSALPTRLTSALKR